MIVIRGLTMYRTGSNQGRWVSHWPGMLVGRWGRIAMEIRVPDDIDLALDLLATL